MGKISWNEAPHWADRVVRGGTLNMNYWASDCMLQPVNNSCPPFKTNTHVRDNFQVVERRPTADTGIDWSKAPEWADRVVKGPMTTFYYWANDEQRVVIDFKSKYAIQDNQIHMLSSWEVVERRPAHFPTRPPETFMCRCVASPVSRTIEQRIASLRALEKRVEETRAELTRDLETLGLTWMVRFAGR